MDLMTAADGGGVEDLTEELQEKLRKEFMPSESDEEGPTPDHITNGLEWTTGKAEAEPETVRVRQKVPIERSSEEISKEEDEWTRRGRRLKKHRPAGRDLRRSKAEDRPTWFRGAWELVKQVLKNVLCILGIICLLAMRNSKPMMCTSTTAMAVFNASHGTQTVGSDCTAGRVDVHRTQYREIFLCLGDENPASSSISGRTGEPGSYANSRHVHGCGGGGSGGRAALAPCVECVPVVCELYRNPGRLHPPVHHGETGQEADLWRLPEAERHPAHREACGQEIQRDRDGDQGPQEEREGPGGEGTT